MRCCKITDRSFSNYLMNLKQSVELRNFVFTHKRNSCLFEFCIRDVLLFIDYYNKNYIYLKFSLKYMHLKFKPF